MLVEINARHLQKHRRQQRVVQHPLVERIHHFLDARRAVQVRLVVAPGRRFTGDEPLRHGHQRIRPVRMSLNITKSPARLYQGCLKVAGRLCSKKKWPTQAKP